MQRRLFEAEHEAFRESVCAFLAKEVTPHLTAWEAAGIVPRELFTTAGAAGFLGMAHAPFVVQNPNGEIANLSPPKGVDETRMGRRLSMLRLVERRQPAPLITS